MKLDISKIPYILVITSGVLLFIAIALTGGSLSKSVKWNLYDSRVDYGGGSVIDMYAYQNLWTSYDAYPYNKVRYIESYVAEEFREESWRDLTRNLVVTSTVFVVVSFIILVLSVILVIKRKVILIYILMTGTSILSLSGGVMLIRALSLYHTKYPSLHGEFYIDPSSGYPQEDYLSTGFYMASVAVGFIVLSAILNIITIYVIKKTSQVCIENINATS